MIPTAVGVVGAIVAGLVLWNNIRSSPESGTEIDRDVQKSSWSDYFNIGFNRTLPEPQESKNSSPTEIENILSRNMTTVEAVVDGKRRKVFGLYIQKGVLMISRHFFKKDTTKEEMLESLDLEMNTNGVKHKCRAYPENMVRIGKKDMVLLYVTKAPQIARKVDYLLPRISGEGSFRSRLLYIKDGKSNNEILNAKYHPDVSSYNHYYGKGLEYVSTVTKEGFCGSIILADRRDGAILGFHLSGRSRSKTSRWGYAQEILYSDYELALQELLKLPSVLDNKAEMGTLCTTRLGLNLIPNKGPHPKTVMFKDGEMDPHPCMEVLGHDPCVPKYRSRVRRGLLSKSIEKHCNEPCRWKAPDMKQPWVHHNKALRFVAEGSWEVPPKSLRWAVEDYWNQIYPKLISHKERHPDLCRKLTIDEAINGVPTGLYMGEFKMNTAAGIPSGTKEDSGLFERIDPYEDGRKRYKLTKLAEDHLELMLSKFRNNESYGIYVRTCLKDEVVAEDSEKVRIFYILECLFAMICRQYFLPIAEFISRHPVTTECMVGLNCAGPEWETVVNHLEELALDDQLVDWDYSKYDLKRSPDVMIASLKLMIRMAEFMGYSKEDLKLMEVLAEEMRNPIVNWNGTIIWMYLWCSGNTMTVYGNSLENSLHQRVSFHWNASRKWSKEKLSQLRPFNTYEHIITYGDDGCSGSHPDVRELTGFSAKFDYFSSINMKITDAKKSGNPSETVHKGEVDFLKRRSVYHEALNRRVGALDKESIWKMGHMSSGSGELEDLAVASIQSMLTEAFLHGKEFYEELREKLKICAVENNVMTDHLHYDYEYRIANWESKYSQFC
jgi:hypothetical protein